MKQILDIYSEVIPALPPGHGMMHVIYAMKRTQEWDSLLWTDFIEAHWKKWIDSTDNSMAHAIRRQLLNSLVDSEQIKRLKNLSDTDSTVEK